MIILFSEGQTCNKFWQYSCYLGECIENNTKLIILNPDIAVIDYPNLLTSNHIIFPFYQGFLKLILGDVNLIAVLEIIFNNRGFKYIFSRLRFNTSRMKIVFSDIRDKSSLREKHKDVIKVLFSPSIGVKDEFMKVMSKNCEQNSTLFGVHIRQGDYIDFEKGRFFYSIEEYYKIMLKIEKTFPDLQIVFFISSNTNVNLSYFEELNCFNIDSNSSDTKDLYGLSQCDYILGPPSTFSGWASYMNDVPIYFIEKLKDPIDKNSFKLIQDIWTLNDTI